MGCFSYICQGCKTGINSTSFEGELCDLYLLVDGKVVEELHGAYDSYGRVFGATWTAMEWGDIVYAHFEKPKGFGIAAFHQACRKGQVPTVKSKTDRKQGWGRLRSKFLERKE